MRAGLLTVVLVFCGYGLAVDWPQVQPALGRLHWYSISGAALAAMAGAGCMTLAWREVLADLGTRLAVPAAIRIMFVARSPSTCPVRCGPSRPRWNSDTTTTCRGAAARPQSSSPWLWCSESGY